MPPSIPFLRSSGSSAIGVLRGALACTFVVGSVLGPAAVVAAQDELETEDETSTTEPIFGPVDLNENDYDNVETVEISGLDYLQAGFEGLDRDPDQFDAIDRIRLSESESDPEVTRLEGGTWVVPFVATGIGPTVRLVGQVNEISIRIPVPDGTLPTRLRATMTISPDIDTGYIEYFGSGSIVRTINLGFRNQRGPRIEVELDLTGMEPTNGTISITMRNRLRSDDVACTTSLIGAWVDFTNGVFIFEGDPTPPTTVGTFVPSLLEELRIYTPSDPSRSEAEAASRIVNAVVRSTLGGNPVIDARTLDAPDRVPVQRYQTTVRSIVISQDMPAGARLVQSIGQGVVLVIGGDSGQLEVISKAWSGDLAELMAGTTVDVIRYDPDGRAQLTPDGIPLLVDLDGDGEFDKYDPEEPPAELLALEMIDEASEMEFATGIERNVDESGDLIEDLDEPRQTEFTFQDLGINRLRVVGLGRMEIPIFVDQSSFGGPVQAISVHLEGAYTPLGPGAEAVMSVFLNGILVDATNLEGNDGHFESDFDLEPLLLARNTSVAIVVDYSPPSGFCRPGEIPFTLQLSPLSFFDVDPGEILPPGFERFPQNLVPEDFHVALDSFSTDRLDLALRLVAALQRTTNVALDPTFIHLDRAADIDGPVVMITASGPDWLSSAPLLATNPITVINDERIERLRFDVDLPHAVLEAFEFHDDDRLILTWNSGHSDDPGIGLEYASDLVDSFSTRDESWKILFGDTYLLSAGSPPLAIAIRDDTIQPTPLISAPDYIARAKPLLIAAIFAGLVVWLLNRVRVWRLKRLDESDARRAMQLSMAHIADQLDFEEPPSDPGTDHNWRSGDE